jgi:hypothetical protein
MFKFRLFTVVVLILCQVFLQAVPASASPNNQEVLMGLYGTVRVGEVYVPAGITITALVNDSPYASTYTVQASGAIYYTLNLQADEGDEIKFKIGNLDAEQTFMLQAGNYTLDLTALLHEAWVDDGYDSGTPGWGLDHFASIQTAINALAPGGSIQVEPGAYSGTLIIPKPLALSGKSFPQLDADGNTAVVCSADGNVLIKGVSVQNANPVLHLGSTTCNLLAYANNFPGVQVACIADGCSSANLKHNWWGSFTAQPVGLNDPSWAARLGAAALDWADGSGVVSLGDAALTGDEGQTDLAAIVNHGNTPPFLASSSEVMCSNYYDFFLAEGESASDGSWSLSVPVNTSISPCHNLFDGIKPMKLAFVTDIQSCLTSPALCWASYPSVTKAGDHLLVASNVGVSDLEGTPFVAGSTESLDPTALLLVRLNAESQSESRLSLVLVIVISAVLGLWVTRMKFHSQK